MEPLKEMFNELFYENFADKFKAVHQPFLKTEFLKEVLASLSQLSLNERMRHTSVVLKKYLPADYGRSINIMREVIPNLGTGYTTLIFPDYVSQFGTKDFDTSLKALHYFTRFGSSEFAIRTFLRLDFDQTIKHLYKWSEDVNEHVRRLASEGSRPRLPWSFKLDQVIENPELTKPILENLKEDESLYVRKSVANHLNDITKDSPDYVLALTKTWNRNHPHTAWIVKRGCRSLFKEGDSKSFALFNYTRDFSVSIKKLRAYPSEVKIGTSMTFEFELNSLKDQKQKLMIDYRIHYVKKSGALLPKVFKLKEVELNMNDVVGFSKKQRFQNMTTRKHEAGKHKLEILVNGVVIKSCWFMVVK